MLTKLYGKSVVNNSQELLSIARCLVDSLALSMEGDVLTNNKNLILWFEDHFETIEPFMEYIKLKTVEIEESIPGVKISKWKPGDLGFIRDVMKGKHEPFSQLCQ